MQSIYDSMTIVGSLVIMVAIIFITYYASRWYAGRMSKSISGRHIKIVDRVVAGPGCSLIVVQAGEKFYLVGMSDKNIQLLCELTDFDPDLPATTESQASFSQLFQGFLHKAGNSKDDGAEK